MRHAYRRGLACIGVVALMSGCGGAEPENTDLRHTPVDAVDTKTGNEGNSDHSRVVAVSPLNPQVSEEFPDARYATAGYIQAQEQRPGDVAAGRQALLDEAYVSCGLPERVFRNLLDDTTVMEAPDRASGAAGLPYSNTVSTNSEGQSVVSSNCLTCHGAPLFGELVIGLGNEFLDFTGNPSALVERAGALVRGASETASWELYADRIAAISPYISMHTVGVNPANNLTFALIAHRRVEDHSWSDQPILALPPEDPAPVSVPPWWRMKKKPAMFNLGEGRGDHARIMMAASMLCTDTPEALQSIDDFAPDIRAFISSIEAPAWPFERDAALAAEGEALFVDHCAQCHGTYEAEGDYPARLVPLEIVQTDSTLVDFAHGEGAVYIDWFNRSYYGQLSTAAPGPGYVAPPLDGIWATAPFLHNGSVPSIRAVLNSRLRPTRWRHLANNTDDKASYDQQDLGWKFDVMEREDVASPKPADIYDTTLPGYSNSGHVFGDHLSEAERLAVLEYLKGL